MSEDAQRTEYGEDDVRRNVRNGTIWMVVVGLVLAYPLGYMSAPNFPLIPQLLWGAVLGVMVGFVIVGFVDQFLRDRRYRREERRRLAR